MSDDLLSYYNDELSYIRRVGEKFSKENPKIAANLGMSTGIIEDPHVSRLIESFAFLNARIRHKIDDDFPELNSALLDVLYPHYQAPIPSMSMLQFKCEPEMTVPYQIPPNTMIESDPANADPCRFATAYPVTVLPIEVTSAALSGKPIRAPKIAGLSSIAASSLCISLECSSKDITFTELAVNKLRFYLNVEPQHVYHLYELIFNNTIGIALAKSFDDDAPIFLDKSCIKPVGFELDEGLLPYPPNSFLGYRLLTELFTFPEKFLFFDLVGLNEKLLNKFDNQLDIYFYFNRAQSQLERNISESSFLLGCSPIINIFNQSAEPIALTQHKTEYQIIPDARRTLSTEVYAIRHVTELKDDGGELEYLPFYGVKHDTNSDEKRYWHATRRDAKQSGTSSNEGTEVLLSLTNLAFSESSVPNSILNVDLLCTNRNQPQNLLFGGDEPRMQFSDLGAPIKHIKCLTPFTPVHRLPLHRGMRWRLISHLSLNHLSLMDDEFGIESLREILRLYDFNASAETQAMIEGIVSVSARRKTARCVEHSGNAFYKGIEITLQFDESQYHGTGLFLMASVLERFFALYSSINSFTELVITTKQHEGELCRWLPRAGESVLL